MSEYGLSSSYEGHKERRTGKIRGTFSRMDRALNGWMLARALASAAQGRPPPPWTLVFPFSLFLYAMCGLEKLGLVDQNWLERDVSALLLRRLAVGRQQLSESIGAALDMEEGGLMNRFDIGRCHY